MKKISPQTTEVNVIFIACIIIPKTIYNIKNLLNKVFWTPY